MNCKDEETELTNNDFNIYPNPTSGLLQVNFSTEDFGNGILQID